MSMPMILRTLTLKQSVKFPSSFVPSYQSLSRILTAQSQHDHSLKICRKYATAASHGTQIYSGPLASRIRSVKCFSLMTSLMGLIAQPVLIKQLMDSGGSIVVMIFSGVFIQFFTFVTPFVLHYFTKKYVKVMYYDSSTDTYTAVTHTFWATDKLVPFKREDVVIPDISSLFTTIIAKGHPLFFDVNSFEDYGHYKKLMGFDKPIDFKLEKSPPKS